MVFAAANRSSAADIARRTLSVPVLDVLNAWAAKCVMETVLRQHAHEP